MTRGEFAFDMWNLRGPWNRVLAAMSMKGFTPKTTPVIQEETEITYAHLKTMKLDGADMEKVWEENPVHNTEPIECFVRHVDYLMDEYEKLVSDEIQGYVDAENSVKSTENEYVGAA